MATTNHQHHDGTQHPNAQDGAHAHGAHTRDGTHAHAHDEADAPALAELLDLDALVLQDYLTDITTWVQRLAANLAVTRVLDLGAGTGTGTIALAGRFPDAQMLALDFSPFMLARVQHAAQAAGLAERITAVSADLNTGWPNVDPVDLVWSASALHEMAQPERLLRDVFGALTLGGLFVAVEMDAPPRFLPDDIGFGQPGLETRQHAAVDAKGVAFTHPNWGPRLEQAGFVDIVERTFEITLPVPQPAATGRYARAYLVRVRSLLQDLLADDDLDALDALLGDGPGSLLHRGDLTVRTSRTAWVGRRP